MRIAMKAIVLKSFGGPESFESPNHGVRGKIAIAVERQLSESME